MSLNFKYESNLIKRQIEILSSCNEGLLSSLILEAGYEQNNKVPLFYIDNNMRLLLPNDINSHIRMSYLTLLKICFQKNSELSEPILNRLKHEICRDDISLNIYPAQLIDCRYSEYYQDNIFKKILLEFFILLKLSNRSVIDYISRYPILDTILLVTFKTLLWHRKPTRLIETQILSIDCLLTYFREVLGIKLVNVNGIILFQDFGIQIGFENYCLYLYDEDARRMTFAQESRVQQFDDQFKTLWNNISEAVSKTPERNQVQKVLNNSWVIPEQSIYERLESEDYMFTEETPEQSRQREQINDLISSFKKRLTNGVQSLQQSKQNNYCLNRITNSQRAQYSRSRHQVLNDNNTGSRSSSQQYFFQNDKSIVKLTQSFEEVVTGYNLQDRNSPKIRIDL